MGMTFGLTAAESPANAMSFGAVRHLHRETVRGTRALRATAASSLVRVSDFAVLGPPVVPGHHVGHRAHRVGRL